MPGFKFYRISIICIFICIAIAGTVNLAQRKGFGIEVTEVNDNVIVASLEPEGAAFSSGIKAGDVIHSIASYEMTSAAQADWYLKGIIYDSGVEFEIRRNNALLSIYVEPSPSFSLGFILLNLILGVTFICTGLMVWWSGNRDPTVKSFFRLNSVTGIAILLFSHENVFHPVALHHLYTITWLFTYCMVPAAYLQFLLRFPRQVQSSQDSVVRSLVLYLPMLIVFCLLAIQYQRALGGFDPLLIRGYEAIFQYGFNTLLVVFLTAGLMRLIYLYIRPENPAERDRTRWLLICTIMGIAPFIFLYKLPLIFSFSPLIPLWAALAMILVLPVGWGMTVASFHMLKLEWALSRTIIYIISIALILYMVLTIVLLNVNYLAARSVISLGLLTLVGAGLLIFAVFGMVRQIRKFVDKFYYRDWYSGRQAVQDLGHELSRILEEKSTIEILTVKLPEILRIEKATLLSRDEEGVWGIPEQTHTIPTEIDLQNLNNLTKSPYQLKQATGDDSLDLLCKTLDSWGYQVVVLVRQANRVIGALLLARKNSGAPYSLRDYHLLDVISNQAAVAMTNVALSHRIIDHEKRGMMVDIAGGIAHEINNALGPLMGQAQLTELEISKDTDSATSTKLAEPIKIMVDMCHRIKRIAQNLTRLSEPLKLEMTPVSLNDIAEDALRILSETAGRIKRFATDDPTAIFILKKAFDPEAVKVQVDAQQIGQVFMNLIINAADALEEQGEGHLTVGTRHDDANVIGFVVDNGPGIPSNTLEKVLDPYFTTKAKDKGTGLGLAIVRSIVEAHGGRVSIHSIPGKGTRVEFAIPLTRK